MNFLLHMIGQAHRETRMEGARPSPRQALLRRAAVAATEGRFAEALAVRQQVGSSATTNMLVVAHLQLAGRDFTAARETFEQLIDLGADDADTPLQRQIETADAELRAGRYVRARNQLQQARNSVDVQLSAHAGLLLANCRLESQAVPGAESTAPLVTLAKLGDLLLRMLARTHLAANVAQSLRERALRDDLAPWATTSQSVDQLLRGEFDSLREASGSHPDHAESNYRLGLMARAVHDLEAAADAFARVLAMHPHHTLAATRLAATLVELQRAEGVISGLAVAWTVPAQTLGQYHQLASAARDRRAFDQTLETLSARLATPMARATLRANLAFALGEMGLLDEERSMWTEPAAMAQGVHPS